MFVSWFILALCGVCSATVTLKDPADYTDLHADASDNSFKAIYDITPVMYQAWAIVGPYMFAGENHTSLDHETFTVNKNDTSVIVASGGAETNISFSKIIKYGYSSNLFQASFFGSNAAINIANTSTLYIDHSNITTHNGAANVYAFGTGTTAYVSNSDLYSSGPTAHGLYAAGNATIWGYNVRHYSGGNRCSSFAGDSPGGYVHVYDSIAHTKGIGSAIFYALGQAYGTDIVGWAENSPILFMDGNQLAVFNNVDLTAGLLAGTVMFSSAVRQSNASLSFANSRLTTTGKDMPGLWFGNVIASASLYATEISTVSGILVVANYSQVTQEFDYFAGYPDNNDLAPAIVAVSVAESTLNGDLVAYNSSSVTWNLSNHSSWTGSAYSGYGAAEFAVSLDKTSAWTLTHDTKLQNFTNEDSSMMNVKSGGFTLFYNASSVANKWLKGAVHKLSDGGFVKPM
ncbi:hypothetical protein AOQ84DRAFT_205055 [Glonium stellatum]|uniref:Uncharacterized protein n=1 Tax=Glonium stellatum TaxID=574774 RepID=A0A8E2JVR4_9PEZI|nr:hypothetical protein AOQ84DRAFT_205055 [Glonium stellatum]